MKVKVFFLGLLAAAALISCNNNVIDDGPGGSTGGHGKSGVPVYASVSFKVYGGTSTYAGAIEREASTKETAIANAAMYVYETDILGSISPEAAVYVPTLTLLTSTIGEQSITIRTTSGLKKIFIAVNPNQVNKSLVRTSGLDPFVAPMDSSFNGLNNRLYTTSATDWALSPLPAVITTKADGLIKGLAQGAIFGEAAATVPYAVDDALYSGTYAMLMTNWDGPDDEEYTPGTAVLHNSNCVKFLEPDIDSLASNTNGTSGLAQGTGADVNHFTFNVQRAFSKVSLKITAPSCTHTFTTTGGFSDQVFKAAVSTSYAGEFQPWTAAGADVTLGPIWSLGNIHKETVPFQIYNQGVVRDVNYLCTTDSITNYFGGWVSHYDNTRIFPTTMTKYPNYDLGTDITTANVKTQMTTADNYTDLSNASKFYYALATENARQHPVKHDFGTYFVIGGRYNPEQMITTIERANDPTNPPSKYWNGHTTANTPGPDYAITLGATDSLYYLVSENIFILGKDNVLGYYAWDKQMDPDADPDFSNFSAAFEAQIESAIANDDIMLYVGGQCYYRGFIRNDKATFNDIDVTLRNHIYALAISEIKGPGIADPNKILIPGKDIEKLNTHVTVAIQILDWHEVEQDYELDWE